METVARTARVASCLVRRGGEWGGVRGSGVVHWGKRDALDMQSPSTFVPRDAQCGKLQCLGGEQRPLAPHTVPVDSTVGLGSSEVTCRGVFLLPGVQLDLHDVGLVEPGTQCGPRMVSPVSPAHQTLP